MFQKSLLYSCYLLQQSIEKILKALFQKKTNTFPPRTHNLIYLCEVTEIINNLNSEQEDLIYSLNPLNLETRYPEYRDKIAKSLTREKVNELLIKTKEFQEWIKRKL
ncbi:MAG: HEPN domain-containing protein [Stygiobacter sp.]